MNSKLYGKNFYRKRDDNTAQAAIKVLRIVTSIFSIKSAVDFGCGVGTWLKCLKMINGNNIEILGLDGGYVPKEYIVLDLRGGNFYLPILSRKSA